MQQRLVLAALPAQFVFHRADAQYVRAVEVDVGYILVIPADYGSSDICLFCFQRFLRSVMPGTRYAAQCHVVGVVAYHVPIFVRWLILCAFAIKVHAVIAGLVCTIVFSLHYQAGALQVFLRITSLCGLCRFEQIDLMFYLVIIAHLIGRYLLLAIDSHRKQHRFWIFRQGRFFLIFPLLRLIQIVGYYTRPVIEVVQAHALRLEYRLLSRIPGEKHLHTCHDAVHRHRKGFTRGGSNRGY